MFILRLQLMVLWLAGVFGALYPTKPVANTIYTAGKSSTVTWIDDGHRPSLAQLGSMQIDLYTGDSTWVTTLATDIDPTSLETTVFMPSRLPSNIAEYSMRFTNANRSSRTDTANFIVASTSGPSTTIIIEENRPETSVHRPHQTPVEIQPIQIADLTITQTHHRTLTSTSTKVVTRSVRRSTTIISRIARTSSSHKHSSSSSIISSDASSTTGLGASSTVTADPLAPSDSGFIGKKHIASVARARFNVERFKFRFVFIIWPALVGLSMAI